MGELWSTCRLPHYNTFYQKGANKNCGMCRAVRKHLNGVRVDADIPNMVVIDVTGFSEPIRIIGIYWRASKQHDREDIQPHVVDGIISDMNTEQETEIQGGAKVT